jgi:hypothetical protein
MNQKRPDSQNKSLSGATIVGGKKGEHDNNALILGGLFGYKGVVKKRH